jgi:predicted ATP-grasp superfamily ATP-dependent carboligase
VEQNPPHIFTLLKSEEKDSTTLIAVSRRPLPAEQASLWAETVIAEITPSLSTFVVSSILSMEYRGPGDAAEENLIFKLQNTKAIEKECSTDVPRLPEGTLLSGIPAAVLEVCDDSNHPATALVAVESSPVPDVALVCALADVICASLGRKPVDAAGKAAVAGAVGQMYQSSASNSMFI